MINQFFTKPFWITLAVQVGIFLLAIPLFHHQSASTAALIVCAIVVLAATVKRLEYGIFALFAELFANSHGHILYVTAGGIQIGLRMAVFAGLMLGYGIVIVRGLMDGQGRESLRGIWNDSRLRAFAPLAIAIVLGLATGLFNDPVRAFKDGNGYIYLLAILPVLSVHWDSAKQKILLQILAASAAFVSLLSLGLFFVFTHAPLFTLADAYTFIRDTRTGELTQQKYGQIFRVFLQSQFTTLSFALLIAPLLFFLKDRRSRCVNFLTLTVLLATLVISLSRSFWIALIGAAVAMLVLIFYSRKTTIRSAVWSSAQAVLAGVASLILLVIILLLPYPGAGHRSIKDLTALLSDRGTETTDAAIDSRWKLLTPMLTDIKAMPISGYGFGHQVEFITDDPRIRAQIPDGRYLTYSMEWGWLELWLKMGILGPLAFLYLFYFFARGLWPYLRGEQSWIGIGGIGALIGLALTHVFSPYLNHPLGLGLFLILAPFLEVTRRIKEPAGGIVAEKEKTPAIATSVPAFSKTE